MEATALTLHAKTYYTNIDGGDEHYLTNFRFDNYGDGTCSYGGPWTMKTQSIQNKATPLGGYLYVGILLADPVANQLQGAQLVLAATWSYWGSPTGNPCLDWSASLYDTTYKVTRVTC